MISEALAALEEQHYAAASAPSSGPAEPRNARFAVEWRFDGTTRATVTINRRAGTIEVRPYRRRRSYVLPLADVAQFLCERIAKAEAAAKRKARRAR